MTSELDGLQSNVTSKLAGLQRNVISELAGLQSNVTSELAGLQSNVTSELDGLQSNVTSKLAGLQRNVISELAGLQSNVTSELAGLQSSVTSELAGLQELIPYPTPSPTSLCSYGDTGGWRRVVYLHMTDPNTNCPSGWQLTSYSIRTCERVNIGHLTCDSVTFPVSGGNYSRVCGRIIGYQYGPAEAFEP